MKIRTVALTLMLLLLAAPSAFADDADPPIIISGGNAVQPSDGESSILTYVAILVGHSWTI